MTGWAVGKIEIRPRRTRYTRRLVSHSKPVDNPNEITMQAHPAALAGITILDLSRVLAGPFATMLLGDLGADVIKVERPGDGDDTRHWGPPFTAQGESAYYLCANRNKRSLTLNLGDPAGSDILRELVSHADVLVENFRAGAMERWGVGYAALRSVQPGLVYCAITGYGQTGPYRDRPGYDNVIEAQGGLMSITGQVGEDGEPYKVGVAIADITAGLYAAMSILAALRHRDASGEGQYIDVALFDVQLSWLANVASAYLVSGEEPRRYGNAHPSIVPYQTVRTADGWLMLAVGNDGQFGRLCDLLGRGRMGVRRAICLQRGACGASAGVDVEDRALFCTPDDRRLDRRTAVRRHSMRTCEQHTGGVCGSTVRGAGDGAVGPPPCCRPGSASRSGCEAERNAGADPLRPADARRAHGTDLAHRVGAYGRADRRAAARQRDLADCAAIVELCHVIMLI